uniref:Uncharacterized protein n=1 Tax=Picea glauca TaxID=3330 RepID=A0A124GNC5_PICGL|nr:hypothetical protein ABT39_MTgene5383 [Picea glauca]QHR86398.1 hypothetical protein Q903MT_gene397 [Picea sitchensis]
MRISLLNRWGEFLHNGSFLGVRTYPHQIGEVVRLASLGLLAGQGVVHWRNRRTATTWIMRYMDLDRNARKNRSSRIHLTRIIRVHSRPGILSTEVKVESKAELEGRKY